MLIQLFALFCLCVYYAWRPILTYCRLVHHAFRVPSASGALPFIGHGHKALKDNHQLYAFLCQLSLEANEQDGICTMWIGPVPLFFITDPDVYKKIANTCLDKNYVYRYMEKFLGGSIILADGSLWKHRIKLVAPSFSAVETDNFLKVFNEQSRTLTRDLACRVGQGPFEHRLTLVYATLGMIFQTAFGLSLEDESISSQEYKASLLEAVGIVMERFRNPFYHLDCIYKLSALGGQYERAVDVLQKASMKVLKTAKESNSKRGGNDSEIRFRPFLEQMLASSAAGGLTDEQIRAELNAIIVAGFDSVTVALATTLVLLGAHPAVQDNIYAELKQIFGDSDRDVTKEDLERMVYLEAAIRESLRYWPTAPFTGRELDRDVQFKQYTLPAGASVFLSHWGVGRQRCWGPDADQYRPERWLDPATLPSGLATDSNFGVGVRVCVGKLYAMASLKSSIAHLVRRYRIAATTEGIRFEVAISLQPVKGLAIALELR